MKHTPLFDIHMALGARMVDFAGWQMPIHYGSQIEEHHVIRNAAGMFDVSHMCVIDIEGNDAKSFLLFLLANNIDKLKQPGKALYSCMLNEKGGVIDDLICYFMADNYYRLVVNAGTSDKDIAWIEQCAKDFAVSIAVKREYAILAIQGPQARQQVIKTLKNQLTETECNVLEELKRFHAKQLGDFFVARTGYTGEDGFEIILPVDKVVGFWNQLLANDVKPCGLGARDTLRLEAGLNLYGQDMDETTTPLESNLSWTVAFEPMTRDFIGKKALEQQKNNGLQRKLVGLELIDKGVLRPGQILTNGVGEECGIITSGTFSPSLKKSIAMARIDANVNESCNVVVRGKTLAANRVKIPFI